MIRKLKAYFQVILPGLKYVLDHLARRLLCCVFQLIHFVPTETPTESTQIFLGLFDSFDTRYRNRTLTDAPVNCYLLTIDKLGAKQQQ